MSLPRLPPSASDRQVDAFVLGRPGLRWEVKTMGPSSLPTWASFLLGTCGSAVGGCVAIVREPPDWPLGCTNCSFGVVQILCGPWWSEACFDFGASGFLFVADVGSVLWHWVCAASRSSVMSSSAHCSSSFLGLTSQGPPPFALPDLSDPRDASACIVPNTRIGGSGTWTMLSDVAACCCVMPVHLGCPAGSWSSLPHRAEGFPGLVPSLGSLWVQPFPSPASAHLFLVVPKTCIGGSGARTTRVEQRVAPPVLAGVYAIWGLLGTGVLLARLLGPWLQCGLQCIWQFVNCFFFRLLCWLRPREPRVLPCSSSGVCGSYCQPWLGVGGILVCGCCGLALACGPSAFDLEAQSQALLRSCALSVLLSLVGLLAGPLGWAGSPLGRPLALLCRKGTCPCHCLARCAQTDVPVLPWSEQRHPTTVRPMRVPTCGRKGLGLLCWLLWSQPCLVWAPPPGLAGAIEDLESIAAGLPDSLTPSVPAAVVPCPVGPRPSLDPHVSAGRPAGSSCLPSWSSVVADVRREALHEVGIPDPVVVPGSGVLPADRHVPGMPPFRVPGRFQCSTLVVSPGYMPERLQLTWNVPSEARDIERLVARHLPHNCYPFASHVLAAHPQPSADFAAFLAIPEWITYAGLSGVVLDLRAATLQQDGPIIGTYLSRPTSLAEIEREAGFYSMGAFTVLVGASMVPLRRDEQVFLENGSLVRLIRAEFPLDRCASLTDLLESDDFSHFQGPFPHVPEPRALMILHRSGRFLFGAGRSAGQPIHTAIVNFVGVPEGSVTFHSPSDGCAERITHRGSNVRGELVLADRLPPRDQSIVIFLDLRSLLVSVTCALLTRV